MYVCTIPCYRTWTYQREKKSHTSLCVSHPSLCQQGAKRWTRFKCLFAKSHCESSVKLSKNNSRSSYMLTLLTGWGLTSTFLFLQFQHGNIQVNILLLWGFQSVLLVQRQVKSAKSCKAMSYSPATHLLTYQITHTNQDATVSWQIDWVFFSFTFSSACQKIALKFSDINNN